jgi:hypothetical protein
VDDRYGDQRGTANDLQRSKKPEITYRQLRYGTGRPGLRRFRRTGRTARDRTSESQRLR